MAQARVSDYFGSFKKSSHEAHPSKRRKVEPTHAEAKADVISEAAQMFDKNTDKSLISKQSGKTPRTQPKAKATRRKSSARKESLDAGQVTIENAFAKPGSSGDTDSQEVLGNTDPNEVTEEIMSYWDEHDGPRTPKRKTRPSDSYETPVSDTRATKSTRRSKAVARHAAIDNVTPKKELTDEDKAARGRSLAQSFRRMLEKCTPNQSQKASDDSIVSIIEPSSLSSKPDHGPVSNNDKQPSDAEAPIGKPSDEDKQPSDTETPLAKSSDEEKQPSDAEAPLAMPSDEDIDQLLEPRHPVPISPLPPTPQKVGHRSAKPVTSPRITSSMEKMKELQKKGDNEEGEAVQQAVTGSKKSSKKVIPSEVMRQRLAKCGKLDTLKAKLAEMNSSLQAVRKKEAERKQAEAAEVGVDLPPGETAAAEKKPAPAYERYEHLAKEGPPSLALPGKYQRLLSTFQGTDTVVSMLFNRQAVITFSKLQTAVQSMTRKNFEQKAFGQMKTVYPDAYIFRQEKGLPSFGNKVSGYQLTVEPNLEGLGEEGRSVDKSEKPAMSAQVLLRRKRIFHNTLVNIAKDHHASFLSKQKPAIEVPSSKLTRWHPRFPLDSVPDIEAAELPSPPVQKVQTAKQVLESAKGKLPPRVEAAMSRVAVKSKSSQPKASTSGEQQKSTPTSTASKPAGSAYKGIPLSLLEKIRAKEAAKTQVALTRDPKEDKKTEMIGRLPNLIRSLRTFYVTEKKPSLPFKNVVEKLADSYETFISPAEVEAHLVLLHELAPKWMQVIEIARGKYIKIDKNMDISAIITKLNNLAKSRR